LGTQSLINSCILSVLNSHTVIFTSDLNGFYIALYSDSTNNGIGYPSYPAPITGIAKCLIPLLSAYFKISSIVKANAALQYF